MEMSRAIYAYALHSSRSAVFCGLRRLPNTTSSCVFGATRQSHSATIIRGVAISSRYVDSASIRKNITCTSLRRQIRLYKAPSTRGYATHNGSSGWISSVGAEPGIDPTLEESDWEGASPGPDSESDIKIIDYSDEQIVQHEPTSAAFEAFLRDHRKPDWAACRWVYVNRLNWDVIRRIGSDKGLHPLAIEDVLDTSTLTKVDWYHDHAFMEMTLQKLIRFQPERQRHTSQESSAARFPSGAVPEPSQLPNSDHHHRQRTTKRTLAHQRFGMSTEQVSVFITSDNTVITIFEHSGPDIFSPILKRLQSSQTIVRSSNDPWMLVQAVLDAVVDLSIPIARAVHDTFGELEQAVLTSPSIAQSKQLYVLRSGLTVMMDNTVAIGGLVRTLRDHRSMPPPVESSSNAAAGDSAAGKPTSPQQLPTSSIRISPLTQVYLQDIQDHITTLSNSTHMSIRSAENLTSLIFNTIAAKQNESVRQLTFVSSFFLPLTFLTGYFGMNFETMPSVNENSEMYFWKIAIPVVLSMAVFIVVRTRVSRVAASWRRRWSGRSHG